MTLLPREVIVVDDGSTDRTVNSLRTIHHTRA
ncbi:glycosyltransferase [Mesorhizobium atlanticum]